MTPTPTVLLLVALFWTLPASLAVLAYRRNENSVEKLKVSIHHSIERALNSIRAQAARLQMDG